MSNPTAPVQTRHIQFAGSEKQRVKLAGGTPAGNSAANWTYYPGEMLGINVSGYHQKFDDTAPLRFAGIVAETQRVYVDSGDSDGDVSIDIYMPRSFTVKGSSLAITDVGRRVYAAYSNEVSRTPQTYGNYVGRINRYISATEAEVTPEPYSRQGIGYVGTYVLAATGAVTLTTAHLGKVIVCTGTAAQAITLPALADVDVGEGFLFFKGSGGTFTMTLTGAGAETINGSNTSATMTANYKYVEIIKNETANGTYEWSIIRSN